MLANIPGSDLAWIEYGAGGSLAVGSGAGAFGLGGALAAQVLVQHGLSERLFFRESARVNNQ